MNLKSEVAAETSSESDRWRAWAMLFLIIGSISAVGFGLMLLLSVWVTIFPNAEAYDGHLGAVTVLWAAGLVLGIFVVMRSLRWYRLADAVERNERSE